MPLPSFPPLSTKRLTIRPVDEADLPDLLEINSDPTVTAFLPYDAWRSLDDGRAWLARMNALADAGTGQQFVLELNAQRRVAGTLLLFRHDEGSSRAELGYVLGRKYWRQGLMHEALEAFCAHCFSALGLRRLEAEVNPANLASNALLQRLGFTREGTLRQRWVAKGAAYDTHIYGMLRDEWARLHRTA
jgi:RimJ/RimL family protein N-acetyltransferase